MSTLKHSISLDKVKQLTSRYEKNKKTILKNEFQNGATLPTCETFERAAFDQLLGQDGCVGIRIYYGMDEESNVKLVAVGVDENDQDILKANSNITKITNSNITKIKSAETEEPVFALSDGLRCPPYCTPPPPPPPPDEL